jgi:hypothetical protein
VPIAGLALLPLLTGLPLVFMPVHIAFLEMVIDPVCAVVFEAEKEEKDVMRRPPREANSRNRSFESSLGARNNPALWYVGAIAAALLGLALAWEPARGLFRFGQLHIDDLVVSKAFGDPDSIYKWKAKYGRMDVSEAKR